MTHSDHSRTFRPKRQLLEEWDHSRRGQTRAQRRDHRDGGARGAIEAALAEMADMSDFDLFDLDWVNEPDTGECSDLYDLCNEPELSECWRCGGSMPLHGVCAFCA